MAHTGCMATTTRMTAPWVDDTDRVHDHTTLGFRRGCLACAQLEADFARAQRATHSVHSAD